MYSKKMAKSLMDAVCEYDGCFNGGDDPFNRVAIFHEFFGSWDVAEFLCEYWPETVIYALECMYYDFGATSFFWVKDPEGVDEEKERIIEEYGERWEDYAMVIQDAAFEGAIFIED